MRKYLLGAAMLMAMGTAASADPAHGIWQTEVDDGAFAHVQLGPCANAAAVCGSIISTFRDGGTPYDSPNLGRQLVIDMVPQGGGDYEGSVWRPSNDRIYIGRMEVSDDRLALRGCVAGGLICARQNWVRVQ
ncbi:DUF2147 domain-containing protein [uncultured Roseicyclus sp.]|jgi:uncharacterized protein (DUF2147 family)|uniref:DUF2147 domain-containing protein n=1 Tax=uncultured Roseicyclus sp. TaxID=543072 RepID=UPI00262F68AA|nr:DUF2147 domain-containing protein [uncultured Roseicyclus sp.]